MGVRRRPAHGPRGHGGACIRHPPTGGAQAADRRLSRHSRDGGVSTSGRLPVRRPGRGVAHRGPSATSEGRAADPSRPGQTLSRRAGERHDRPSVLITDVPEAVPTVVIAVAFTMLGIAICIRGNSSKPE
ncbi:hypothetical protein PLANTIT3_30132 [Plantibacter sp. T3]|nr:hypothetical protein PLANTIT3_30132 [Plantibacter sp. T3]